MSPAIRNWQAQPPSGGWSIEYTLPGTEQRWLFKGLPHAIIEGIAEVQQANGIFDGYGPIWDMANAIWTKRDPDRALGFTTTSGQRVQKLVVTSPAKLSRTTLRAAATKACGRC